VKSLGAVYPEAAELCETGFRHDRAWVVVDEDGVFVTQRQFPWLAAIRVGVTDNALLLQVPDSAPLSVPVVNSGPTIPVRVWDSTCESVDQGDAAAALLTAYIRRPCRLVRMRPGFKREPGASYSVAPQIAVGFADSSPLMLVSEASLDDLNSRLETPVEMNRFRSNLVVTGCEPFEEDTWQQVQIAGGTFHLVKDCIRCEIPTVDQETGEKGIEPMETLEGYRAGPLGVRFGRKVAHESLVTVSLGDEVTVIK
jgi:uncharacterized protein YcbX